MHPCELNQVPCGPKLINLFHSDDKDLRNLLLNMELYMFSRTLMKCELKGASHSRSFLYNLDRWKQNKRWHARLESFWVFERDVSAGFLVYYLSGDVFTAEYQIKRGRIIFTYSIEKWEFRVMFSFRVFVDGQVLRRNFYNENSKIRLSDGRNI